MKDRLISAIKWFLIILGAIFLFQIIIVSLAFFGLTRLDRINFDIQTTKKPKEIQQVINYVEQYKKDNGLYPQNLDGLKLNKDKQYDYSLSDDKNCYTVIIKSDKNNITKEYQRCEKKDNSMNANTESYIEYNN